MPTLEEYTAEIAPLWDTHWLTNRGAKHREFEGMLRELLGVEHLVLYTNGHSALEGAFDVFDMHGKVITTPYTFTSTTNAIVRKGFEPVFADIDPRTYTIDPQQVEKLIDDDVCAIVPVHVYGNLCDIDALQQIADEHGLKLIYDAAHAFGVSRNGVSAASFGDASMFSFHATKVFNTIEGGALCVRSAELEEKLYQYENFGLTAPEEISYAGGNTKMNEFCAAMGICNLRHLDDEIAKRKIAAERYWSNLGGVENLDICPPAEDVEPNYAYMPVLFNDGFGATREDVFEALNAEGIGARRYFVPLTSQAAYFNGAHDPADTPVAKYVSDHILTLPLYADLSVEDVDRICDIVVSCGAKG